MTFDDIVDLAEKAGCDVSAIDGREYQTMCCDSYQLERFAAALIQAGAASRDAEVARLKTVPMKYRRMAFNAQLQDENAKLNQQLAAEQAKNVGLRELVEHFALIDLGRSLLPDDFGLWVLRARKALSTPADLSALRAHDAAIWREAMQIAEDSRDKATMSKYSSVPECRAARDMAECLSKAYCHKAAC